MKAVIFDLDGVLIDSKENMRTAWGFVMLQCNIKVPFEKYFAEIGKPFEDILDTIGIHHSHTLIKSIYDHYSKETLNKIEFYDDAFDTLVELKKKYRTGIVTSKSEDRTHKILLKLPRFDWVSCPRKFSRGKPAPDQLLYTLAHLKVDPADAVYVGDMQSDKECADRAGVKFIHANYGYGEVQCEHSLNRLSDLIKLLD